MPLFKDKILSQYIQDEQMIEGRYAALQAYQRKVESIKTFKEEEYQTGFIHDIFEECLGYTLKTANPKNYNIERESKNETDSKKADAAILNPQGEVIAVIELKAQKSQDLSEAVKQAFGYHANHKQSKYIIVSNFNELRFYIDKQTAYEEFNLFTMNKDEFRRFYLILNYQSIVRDLPIEIKKKSDIADADISKKLYADFSAFRLQLFENAKQNNPNIEQKHILRLVQKLCDRIIFILFAEDKGLLNPNTIAEIGQKHTQIKGIAEISLYQIYQKYFQAIDKGSTDLGIMPYNGGLFADDSELNALIISDNILETHVPKLSAYDFKSDISVNILGHIFEQSLSDLEELNAAIDNQQFDYNQSKRKKDGIFYTPEYITQFIVEQTLGKICLDKKAELGLNKEIRLPEKIKKKLNKEEQNLLDRLYQYRNFLLELKIIDPACGSGAFLNQALEFLIKEHAFIDKYRRILENESLGLYDIEIAILENNLYGVDINADAVEIAKLSLWLRTAQKGRKLTDLSNNIICANSLLALPIACHCEKAHPTADNLSGSLKTQTDTTTVIASLDVSQGVRNLPTMENAPKPHSDKEIATPATQARNDGNDFSDSLKAFPQKFDCVIGNPPYVRQEMIKDQKPALQQRYGVYTGTADLFVYFYELGINLLKDNGLLGFICSNKFFRASYGEKLRQFILENTQIQAVADFNGIKVFEDATVDSAITVLQKKQTVIASRDLSRRGNLPTTKNAPTPNSDKEIATMATPSRNDGCVFRHYAPDLQTYQSVAQSTLNKNGFIFLSSIEGRLKTKIEQIGTPLKDWDININVGIKTGLNDAFIIDEKTRQNILSGCLNIEEYNRTQEIIKPILRGRDIKRYAYEWGELYLINFHNGYKKPIRKTPTVIASLEQSSRRGNLPTTKNALDFNNGKEIATPATQARNDGNDFSGSLKEIEIPPLDINDYPAIKKWLDNFEPALSKRSDKGKTPYNLRNCAYLEEFEKEKIVWADISRSGNTFAIDNQKFTIDMTAFCLTSNNENININYIMAILNTPITLWYLEQIYTKLDTTGWRWKKEPMQKIIIPKINTQNQNIAEKIIQLSVELSEKTNALNVAIKNFLQELKLEKIPQKLQNFDTLDFDAFIKEYAKALKIKFTDKLEERNFKQQWQRLFETDQQSVQKLKTQIQTANTAINQMVYQLYDLTDEEIKIVEQA